MCFYFCEAKEGNGLSQGTGFQRVVFPCLFIKKEDRKEIGVKPLVKREKKKSVIFFVYSISIRIAGSKHGKKVKTHM